MKLEVKNVECGYTAGAPVLRDVNFSVEAGEICCLLGPNGVGKTTLFKTVLGLLKPLSGTVRMNGEDISHWSARRLAHSMAYVSQFHNPPFPYRVKDVVLLGRINTVGYFGQPSEMDFEIAEAAMADMGITHLRDTVYTDISGGERQLVMIARALAQEPELLVMDEPTASLDYGNMVRVMSKIRSLRDKGFGIIMTTHSPDQAFMCESTVALLRRGAPLVYGFAAEVITQENMRSAYGVDVKIIEFFDTHNRLVRMCSPLLD
ncbi:MAG: ABC transporter ATP-binding protein [Oscillospiraceae bacterium]|nr:ABC transporter ATP-binding protein [Oscillospiraceae bacterium]MCD8374686.1 ABC transporter ATP-binding protein [Oscillospiraceae bacterium]